jgi:hypothetical protein
VFNRYIAPLCKYLVNNKHATLILLFKIIDLGKYIELITCIAEYFMSFLANNAEINDIYDSDAADINLNYSRGS